MHDESTQALHKQRAKNPKPNPLCSCGSGKKHRQGVLCVQLSHENEFEKEAKTRQCLRVRSLYGKHPGLDFAARKYLLIAVGAFHVQQKGEGGALST